MDALTQAQIDEALAGLDGWSRDGDAIVRQYEFGNFREAVSFIVRLAFEAEQRNHHPEITNTWNRVGLRLTTHDAGNAVTRKDLELAEVAEAIAW